MSLIKVKSRGTDNVSGRRNLAINGDMRIAQRGASAVTINSGSATYRLDRFYASGASSAGVFTVEQSTDTPTDFKNSLKVTVTTADSSIGSTTNYRVNQNIEGQNISHLNYGSSDAKTVTLSFYVKSSLTGTFGGKLGNSARDRSHPFTYTISSANTWEQKTVTITGDTSGTWLDTNGIGFELVWSIGAGSSRLGTAGSWAGVRYDGASGQTNIIATNSSTWLITGVQLEVGDSASDFEHRSFGEELHLCKRYYESKYYRAGTYASAAFAFSTTTGRFGIDFLPKRANASVTFSGSVSVYKDGGSNAGATYSADAVGTRQLRVDVSLTGGATMSAGSAFGAYMEGDWYVLIDAEL